MVEFDDGKRGRRESSRFRLEETKIERKEDQQEQNNNGETGVRIRLTRVKTRPRRIRRVDRNELSRSEGVNLEESVDLIDDLADSWCRVHSSCESTSKIGG